MPPEFVDMIWSRFDRGTRRAILALYRSAPEYALAAAGRTSAHSRARRSSSGSSRSLPPVGFAGAYADRLPNAEPELADAGHWPWVERPEIVERVVAFIDAV